MKSIFGYKIISEKDYDSLIKEKENIKNIAEGTQKIRKRISQNKSI